LKCDSEVSHYAVVSHDTDHQQAQLADEREPTGARYAISELAEAGGVTRRAVRFYVQRGLISPPLGGGRGAYYDGLHLAQLLEIKRRQEAGEPLHAIAAALEEAPPEPAHAPIAEAWSRFVLAPGVELNVRGDALSQAQKAALMHVVRSVLSTATLVDPHEGEPE